MCPQRSVFLYAYPFDVSRWLTIACSSSIGTVSSCYQGSHEPADDPRYALFPSSRSRFRTALTPLPFSRALIIKNRGLKTDPHTEIAHIRQSLATLESFLVRTGTGRTTTTTAAAAHGANDHHQNHRERQDLAAIHIPPPHSTESDDISNKSAPGMLGQEQMGGLYAGPTSMVTHLLSFKSDRDSRDAERKSTSGSQPQSASEQIRPYDDDLLQLLPQLHIIDGTCYTASRKSRLIDAHSGIYVS